MLGVKKSLILTLPEAIDVIVEYIFKLSIGSPNKYNFDTIHKSLSLI